jgi:quercetin dioxygenase-like cupin family protein
MAGKKKEAGAQLRPLDAQVLQFAVLGEMTGLLQRVRANKSKRSSSVLVKSGPIQVQVVALDQGGESKENKVEGPFTIQCLLGRALISIQGHDERLTTGDLLVVEAGVTHDMTAEDASVLLVTVTSAEARLQ